MHLRPLPNVTARALLEAVEPLLLGVANARSGGTGEDLLLAYQRWASSALEALTPLLPPRDLEALVATPWYWQLYARSPGMDVRITAPARLELAAAEARFTRLVERLRAEQDSYQAVGHQLVPDTNVFLHCGGEPESIDWRGMAEAGAGEDVVVFVPLLVVDELDNAKQSPKKDDAGVPLRTRARAALRMLQESVDAQTGRGLVRTSGGVEVQVRLLPDPLGHRRLDRPDDELVDVAAALAGYTGRRVTVISRDAGARFRAGLALLDTLDPGEPASS